MDILTILGITFFLIFFGLWWFFQTGSAFENWDNYMLYNEKKKKETLDKKNKEG